MGPGDLEGIRVIGAGDSLATAFLFAVARHPEDRQNLEMSGTYVPDAA